MWRVQVGKDKGSYRERYTLEREGQALAWYMGINVHSGYKKRLLDPEGRVVARVIT